MIHWNQRSLESSQLLSSGILPVTLKRRTWSVHTVHSALNGWHITWHVPSDRTGTTLRDSFRGYDVNSGLPLLGTACWRAHIHGTAQVRTEIRCGIVCFVWGRPMTYLGPGLREIRQSRRSSDNGWVTACRTHQRSVVEVRPIGTHSRAGRQRPKRFKKLPGLSGSCWEWSLSVVFVILSE
jgi:hypothetical protein